MNGVVNYDYREIGLQYETYWHILNLNVIVGLIVIVIVVIFYRYRDIGACFRIGNFYDRE